MKTTAPFSYSEVFMSSIVLWRVGVDSELDFTSAFCYFEDKIQMYKIKFPYIFLLRSSFISTLIDFKSIS